MIISSIISSILIRVSVYVVALLILTTVLFLILTVYFYRKYKQSVDTESATASNTVKINKEQCSQFDVVILQNQGKREYQQDSLYISDKDDSRLVSEKGVLAVVADGMGGLQDGEKISGIVVDTFKNLFQNTHFKNPHDLLGECVIKAESEVDNYIYNNSMKGGSTVVSTIIKDGELFFASVGDSSIFLVRGNEVRRLNQHHNYAAVLQSKVRQGMITQQEANNDPMRSRITSYIGMGEVNEIDSNSTPIKLKDEDILILCSDGVANALGDNAIISLICSGEFSNSGDRIEKNILAQDIKNQDNFSAIIIKCKSSN